MQSRLGGGECGVESLIVTQLRISEAAALLRVSDDTVRRWVDQGRLAAVSHAGGPMMIAGDYSKATATLETFQKDLAIIGDFARRRFGETLLALASLQLLHVYAVEVDRVEHQRREAGVADRVADDPAGEREQDPRRLCVSERVLVLVGHVAHADEAAIGQLDHICGALRRLGGGRDLELDLGDRTVTTVRPPVFDNPTTRGWYEGLSSTQRDDLWGHLQCAGGASSVVAPALMLMGLDPIWIGVMMADDLPAEKAVLRG